MDGQPPGKGGVHRLGEWGRGSVALSPIGVSTPFSKNRTWHSRVIRLRPGNIEFPLLQPMQRLGLRIRSLSRMDVSVVVGTAAAEWDRLTVQAGLQGGSSNPPTPFSSWRPSWWTGSWWTGSQPEVWLSGLRHWFAGEIVVPGRIGYRLQITGDGNIWKFSK